MGLSSKERQRRWREAHPDRVKQKNEYTKIWRTENPQKLEEYREKQRLNPRRKLTSHQVFLDMLESQGSLCLICKCHISGKTAHTDHCHQTGRIRGILCFNCNTGIGMFKDNVGLLEEACRYLCEKKQAILR